MRLRLGHLLGLLQAFFTVVIVGGRRAFYKGLRTPCKNFGMHYQSSLYARRQFVGAAQLSPNQP